MDNFIWGLLATLFISCLSLIGILAIILSPVNLKKITFWLVSLAVGVLFGDVFFHLLPEIGKSGFSLGEGGAIFFGLFIFLVLEKIICWRHCHIPTSKSHPHPVAFMNLLGDGLHNFLDGLIIGSSFLVSLPLGIATATAIVFHEIPQEIADFGILIHAGFSKLKALFFNFLTALMAVLGLLVINFLSNDSQSLEKFFIPLTVGGFLYIAGSDLVPELKKETNLLRTLSQMVVLVFGALFMYGLTFIE